MTKLFMVDGNWYIHRAVFTTPDDDRNFARTVAYKTLSLIFRDALANRATHLGVAFDGRAVFRYDIFPDYKLARKAGKEKGQGDDAPASSDLVYGVAMPEVKRVFDRLSIFWIQRPKLEGDDILNSTAHWGTANKVVVALGGEDKDLYQGLSKYVYLWRSNANPGKEKLRAKDAERKKGVPIEGMIMYQTLLGDKLDGIIGFAGMGPAKAAALVNKYGTLENWFKNGTDAERSWLRQNQEHIRLNKKLVTLKSDEFEPDLTVMKVPKTQTDLVLPKSYYNYMEFLYPKTRGLF